MVCSTDDLVSLTPNFSEVRQLLKAYVFEAAETVAY